MAADDTVLTTRQGAIVTITMNRPAVLNAVDVEMADRLRDAFEAVENDVRVVILRGAGGSFMAGADLSAFKARFDEAPAIATGLIDRFHAALTRIKSMPQPVIAAVQGAVAGGGLGLALACDLVVAADNAKFVPAYTRLGTSPDAGTTASLTRLLGHRRALKFILLNEPMDAATAMALGLVNDVVAAAELDAAVDALAGRLAEASVGASRNVKRLVQEALVSRFDTQLDLEKQLFVACSSTADFREGVTAFLEKRRPHFHD